PVAGRPYDYSAIISPLGGKAYWYATKSTTFMTGGLRVATEIPKDGVAILANATNYMTLAAAATSPTTTQVTWTSAGLDGVTAAVPLFMVVEYNSPTCTTTNNMKVMQIIPKNAFTVDITNMVHGATPTPLAYDAVESQCFANIVSAAFNTTTKVIDIDYGVNVLYYEIIAANFTGSYKPYFRLSGLKGTQTADIDWGVAVGTYGTSAGTALASSMPYTSPAQTVSTTLTDTHLGVSIYVRVTVKNNGYEGITSDPITLAVEAVDGTVAANKDLDPDGVTMTPFGDLAVQTLNARPSVTAGTPQISQKP
ncbi:MAG TPA: hypothetical protein VGK38_09570, partial [Prolixibacteraceae bacterium]